MKSIYCLMIFISIILAINFVKSDEVNQIPKDVDDTVSQ